MAAQYAQAQLKSVCCDFSAHFHKLDATSPDLLWVKHLAVPFVALVPQWRWQPATPELLRAPLARWHSSDSSPPPRSGRALLAFGCTLVV
ncbi:hypothetical protein GCM10022406_41040 [Hymenobacter algoricola]|uniref:Uncharacterized protein n=2 Tax=Hymenobacter algoricola TaxID=486267 RepID=A0ABP7NWA8_9BACT